MNIRYLVIEGNIGAGKTTLARMISNDYNAKLVLEQFADNPFLPKFYTDPEKYSFPLEMSFLAERYSQLVRQITNLDLFHQLTVSDYYFMKSLIFAGTTLQDDVYQLYRQFFNIVYEKLPKPDLYIYLHLSTDKLLKNIKIRGRDYEQGITSSYLEKIQNAYMNFFRQQAEFPVAVIDTSQIDFVNNQSDYHQLLHAIFNTQYDKGITRIVLSKN